MPAGRSSSAPTTKAGTDLDEVDAVIDLLAYHGQLSTLVGMMRIALPLVRDSDALVPGAADELADRVCTYEVLDYIEQAASPDPRDPELVERLAPFPEASPELVAPFVEAVTGKATRQWTMSDFGTERAPRKTEFDDSGSGRRFTEESADNLFCLSNEFIHYVHREDGVPYTKAKMAVDEIRAYLHQRVAGRLKPQESMLEAAMRPKKRKPARKRPAPANLLCPDRATLDNYLAGLLGYMASQHHKAGAALELVPAWLRFLEARHLLDTALREATLDETRELAGTLAEVFDMRAADPALAQAMKRWPE